jgi:hypothetical protein
VSYQPPRPACPAGLVASRSEFSRRREKLDFAHHQDVATLPPDEQDSWLNGDRWIAKQIELFRRRKN